jgi:iron uptake system EfeUOB component EfeO/EfeM
MAISDDIYKAGAAALLAVLNKDEFSKIPGMFESMVPTDLATTMANDGSHAVIDAVWGMIVKLQAFSK